MRFAQSNTLWHDHHCTGPVNGWCGTYTAEGVPVPWPEGTPGREAMCEVCLLAHPATSFRQWLNYCKYTDLDTGQVKIIGETIWPGQEEFVREVSAWDEAEWLMALKARQIGYSTIEAAGYNAYVMRIRPTVAEMPHLYKPQSEWVALNEETGEYEGQPTAGTNARVSILSQTEKGAQKFLGFTKFALQRLPEWLRDFEEIKDSAGEYQIAYGQDDTRVVTAFAANSVRGDTCTHAHMDEWAFMEDPQRTWTAMEPLCAGTVHFLTTGDGPLNYTTEYWRAVLDGERFSRSGKPVKGVFIGAKGSRPTYTDAFLKNKKKNMDADDYRREYPATWQDAVSGTGALMFKSVYLDRVGVDCLGLISPANEEPDPKAVPTQRRVRGKMVKCKYLIAMDTGRHGDSSCVGVFDCTEDVIDLVWYGRWKEIPFPAQQLMVKSLWLLFGGAKSSPLRGPNVVIEDANAGEALRENLDIPERFLHGFKTTKPSKMRILHGTKLYLQNEQVKWDPKACSQLDGEMREYALPDDNLVQDSVMMLAIGLDHVDLAYQGGSTTGIIEA